MLEQGCVLTRRPSRPLFPAAQAVFDEFENANLAFEAQQLPTVQKLSALLRAFYKSKRCPK